MKVGVKCKYCKSKEFTKEGFRRTLKRGKIQKYKCHNCKRYFTNDEGFYRMRNNEKIITMAIDIYLSNLSSRKMRNQLRRHLKEKVSHMSILDWARKYILKVHKYTESLGYNLGDSFYADETMINRQGNFDRFWACVDWDTRLITGIHYSLSGNPKEAKYFLRKAVSKGKPKYIQTDAGVFYPRAFRRLFYSNKLGGLVVEHKILNVSKEKIHNYKIETVFSKIKDRVHDFRGLKALWSAPILLTGLIIQHNFIEPHTTIKKVPCELAGQKLDLGENRWLDLIRLASQKF
jgi:transposase-like protein